MSNAREVNALLMAISMLPIQAPSIRSKATRFAPASTTAMFIGTPISFAFSRPARMTFRAASKRNAQYLAGRFRCHMFSLRRGFYQGVRRTLPAFSMPEVCGEYKFT